MIKNIGTKAREDIENFLDTKVNLQLWVKIKENGATITACLRIWVIKTRFIDV